ncbi:MAG: leucine-rich repeat domain-containing protein, partial [Clostridia bacterium]|nr:leucine-rich repeat domain-containing protein [Clostridia bacterium]
EEEAFCGTEAERIALPDGAQKIGTRAFAASALEVIEIPKSVSEIAEDAFEGCEQLQIHGASGSYAEQYAGQQGIAFFDDSEIEAAAEGFAFSFGDTDATVTGYTGSAEEVTIPQTVICPETGRALPVAAIGWKAMSANRTMKRLTIPDSVVKIANSAFSSCTALETVLLPDGMTAVGNYTFSGCTALRGITIPVGVETIGDYAFSGCVSLGAVAMTERLVKIADSAFSGCEAMAVYGVEGSYAQTYAAETSRTFVALDTDTLEIRDFAFAFSKDEASVSGYTGMADEVVIPGMARDPETGAWQKVSRIGWKAMSASKSMRSVVIPQSVTEIGNSAFSSCTALERFEWPQRIAVIGSYMFSGCTSLKEIVIPEGVTDIGSYALDGCAALGSVAIPQSVTTIGDYAMRGCVSLGETAIPQTITSIGMGAFNGSAEDFRFAVVRGSYAEEYAQENGIACVYPGEEDETEEEESGVVKLNDVVYDLDWFDYKSFYTVAGVKAGKTFTLTDLMTALSFDVYVQSAGYHADVEPLTAEDTEIMLRIYGVDEVKDISYVRRPMVATVGPVQLVCSMYGEAHGSEDIGEENGYDGQFCVHFRNSTTSGTQEVLEENQAPIDKAVLFVKAKGSEVRTSP